MQKGQGKIGRELALERVSPIEGIPSELHSDRGTYFADQIVKEICKIWHIMQYFHCDYHSQSPGLLKRTNRTIKGKGGMFWEIRIKTCILSRVKQITSPGWMHETSARAWCTGKTQRNRVEREGGAGIGMGNTCKSMANSCQCMAKTTLQYCKVISLQLIKINGKKN